MALALIMCLSLCVPAFAQGNSSKSSNTATTTFYDSEGSLNTIVMTVLGVGHVRSEYYINGELFNTTEATVKANDIVSLEIIDENQQTKNLSEPLSNFITDNPAESKAEISSRALSPKAYSYQGQINYKPYYTASGTYEYYKLSIYQQQKTTQQHYKTINAENGWLANTVISVISAALTIYCAPLAAAASQLLGAAAIAVGVSIVGGTIQGHIQKDYYVKETYFDVKAVDPDTSRQIIYAASSYQVLLDGGDQL